MWKKILVVYGSTTWNNQALAEWIEEILIEEWHDVELWDWTEFSASTVSDYDISFIWSSTWGDWDIQDDMSDFVEDLKMEELNWAKVAVFWNWMSSFPQFCNAVEQIENAVKEGWWEVIWESIKIDWDIYEFLDDVKDWARELAE